MSDTGVRCWLAYGVGLVSGVLLVVMALLLNDVDLIAHHMVK